MARTQEEIVRDAVEAINPPVEAKELCRTRVNECIRHLKKLRDALQPHLGKPGWKDSLPKPRKDIADDAKRLRKVLKQTHASLRYVGGPKFVKELDASIRRLEHLCAYIKEHEVIHGSRQWSLPKQLSVQMAFELLKFDGRRQSKVTLTDKGPWLRLSSLLHEALTGEYNCDLSGYCRKWPRGSKTRLPLIDDPIKISP